MSDATSIEWTDATWNPLRGCTRVSEGCRNCYAERLAARYSGPGLAFEGLAVMTEHGPRWTGAIKMLPEKLDEPLRWKKPRRIFVNSMSDLFHPAVPEDFIWRVFAVMAACKQHTFQILTKRPERMAAVLGHPEAPDRFEAACDALAGDKGWCYVDSDYPLSNVQLGTSVENQETGFKRVQYLLQTPASVRFLSCEPLLGPLTLGTMTWVSLPQTVSGEWPVGHRTHVAPGIHPAHLNPHGAVSVIAEDGQFLGIRPSEMDWCRKLDWLIVGGESGPGARPMHPEWVRSLRDQCQAAGVPFFFKQWGEWLPGQNDPHPIQKSGVAHHQDESWGPRKSPPITETNYVVWYKDGSVHNGDQTHVTKSSRDIEAWAHRVGKQQAGRLLDGVLWDQMPEGR